MESLSFLRLRAYLFENVDRSMFKVSKLSAVLIYLRNFQYDDLE